VRVVTESGNDENDSDNNADTDTTTHWSQQLITVDHAQLDTPHTTQVIEVITISYSCIMLIDYMYCTLATCLYLHFIAHMIKYLLNVYVQVHAKAEASKQSLFGRLLKRRQSVTHDSTSSNSNTADVDDHEHTKPQVTSLTSA
jgi:hypothetical protein